MAEEKPAAKKTTAKKVAKPAEKKELPPVGSSARKAMILRGEIKE